MSINSFLGAQRSPVLLIGATATVALICYLDYLSEWEVSLFVFYAVPIFLVAWYGDRPSALAVALLCFMAWWWANKENNPYETAAGYLWAAGSRFAYFAFVAIGGTALKNQRKADLARIAALERARELERDIVNVSEHEQRRIGQDLHDGLCQVLAGIGCAATTLKEDLQKKSLPEAVLAEEIEGMVRDAGAETRNLARGIFPVLNDGTGLEAALEELAGLSSKLYHRTIAFEHDDGLVIEDPEVAMHLYRIAQEALSNALKHGKAKNVNIALHKDDAQLQMTIADDGLGVSQPMTGSTGMGLRTMNYRARLIGAQLDVESTPLQGTVVRCLLRGRNSLQPTDEHGRKS